LASSRRGWRRRRRRGAKIGPQLVDATIISTYPLGHRLRSACAAAAVMETKAHSSGQRRYTHDMLLAGSSLASPPAAPPAPPSDPRCRALALAAPHAAPPPSSPAPAAPSTPAACEPCLCHHLRPPPPAAAPPLAMGTAGMAGRAASHGGQRMQHSSRTENSNSRIRSNWILASKFHEKALGVWGSMKRLPI
jgi:hypothetical protein